MVPQRHFEPVQIVQGDTINFIRYFGNYPASQGWQLQYNLRGGAQPIQFSSVANGDSHVVNVATAITATWLPNQYEMQGFAVNATTQERERIYFNNLLISTDLSAAAPDVDVKTHAQKMLMAIEAVQLGKFRHDILESEVEGTRLTRLSPIQLRQEYYWWLQRCREEVARDNAKAGRSNGRNRFTVFVDPAGQGINQYGALPPTFPYGNGYPV